MSQLLLVYSSDLKIGVSRHCFTGRGKDDLTTTSCGSPLTPEMVTYQDFSGGGVITVTFDVSLVSRHFSSPVRSPNSLRFTT